MKVSFNLPSCNYNIILNKEDLQELLEKGYITARSDHVPCVSSRAAWNGKQEKLDFLDKKTIPNNLVFGLSEKVADMKAIDWGVQFLGICLDETCKE